MIAALLAAPFAAAAAITRIPAAIAVTASLLAEAAALLIPSAQEAPSA